MIFFQHGCFISGHYVKPQTLCKRNLNTQRAESTDTTNLVAGGGKSYL